MKPGWTQNLACIVSAMAVWFTSAVAFAQLPNQTGTEAPAKVGVLLQLLDDPEVRTWLEARPRLAVTPDPESVSPGVFLSGRLNAIRQHLVDMIAVVPKLPGEIGRAVNRLHSASTGYGYAPVILLTLAFIGLGLIAEMIFRRVATPMRRYSGKIDPGEPGSKPRALAASLLYGLGSVIAFAVGGLGAFLAFDWPDLLRSVVLFFLAASVIAMLARSLLNAVLPVADVGNAFRFISADQRVADYYRRRVTFAIGWFAFGYAFAQSLLVLGVDFDVAQLIAYVLGLVLLAIGLETVLNRPGARSDVAPSCGWSWFFTIYLVLMWLIWIAGTTRLFWLLAAVLAVPLLVIISRDVVDALFTQKETEPEADLPPSVAAEAIKRTIRAALIIAGVWFLAWAWGFGFDTIMNPQDPAAALARNILTVLVILLVIDLVWQVTKTLIDTVLKRSQEAGTPGTPGAIRRAKIRTLLPIVRNALAMMMSLSSLGVEIGPLIASAGVIGIAVGFGAQTLVRDIFSGMFYLLDDAFRVGEYIISGEFRGTVESFSLRSVRLRHHLGPVYTIPFGELGAVQNMSRDFVVDRLEITVTYDTDIEKVRKLIKKIGQQLAEDPALSDSIIEPLKMQRINAFGDYGIEIRLKVTTKPGEQFGFRQKAYPLIKKTFDENGIEFAFPTVRIAEDAGDKVAAAHQMLAADPKVAALPEDRR
jgi:moderate conductance mechanosensitive channel